MSEGFHEPALAILKEIQDEEDFPKKRNEQVEKVVVEVLESEERTVSDKAISGTDLFKKGKEKYPHWDIPENTFTQTISVLGRSAGSKINSLGRGKGYYLAATALDAVKSAEEDELEAQVERTRVSREATLYPILLDWLIERGYRAKDCSSMKTNGTWGNPDTIGLAVSEHFSGIHTDLVTIEVKASESSWKKWFFEAVSHRRFANRAYFAFAHPAEVINKTDPDLRYYSELFGVGVLVVALSTEKFKELKDGEAPTHFTPDEVEVYELYSAPRFEVHPKYQADFLAQLGITKLSELFSWGDGIDG